MLNHSRIRIDEHSLPQTSRSKITRDMKLMLIESVNRQGVEELCKFSHDHSVEFSRIASKLVPIAKDFSGPGERPVQILKIIGRSQGQDQCKVVTCVQPRRQNQIWEQSAFQGQSIKPILRTQRRLQSPFSARH